MFKDDMGNNYDDSHEGIIKNVFQEKGYGFIISKSFNKGEKDLYFHAKDCRHLDFSLLKAGDKVSIFGPNQNNRSWQAGKVYPAKV
jgi:cold shock CspA family protein